MMELKKIGVASVAVVVLTVIVLMGIAVTDGFGYTLRTNTLVNESASNTATLSNGTYVRVGTLEQYPYLQSLTGCVNSSGGNALAESKYTIDEGDAEGGYIILNADESTWDSVAVNCSALTYKASSTGSNSAGVFKTAMALFGTFSGIVILSLIGKAIVGIFQKE